VSKGEAAVSLFIKDERVQGLTLGVIGKHILEMDRLRDTFAVDPCGKKHPYGGSIQGARPQIDEDDRAPLRASRPLRQAMFSLCCSW